MGDLTGASLPLHAADFVWLLAGVCKAHGIPFDAALTLQQYPPPHDFGALLRATVSLGLRLIPGDSGDPPLQGERFPIIVIGRQTPDLRTVRNILPTAGNDTPGEQPTPDRERADAGATRIALVWSRSRGGRFSVTRPGIAAAVETTSPALQAEFPLAFTIATLEETTLETEPAPPRPFGLAWFVPELLRHKPLWRDIILGSLALQVLGLAMPLATRIIMDKVVVHQTHGTLAVITVALALFLVFSSVMGWVRQTLINHIGSRVDLVLGARVFEKLLSLSPRYFEVRPTGTVMARLHGVETVRNFITGAATALVLDLPFLLVFVAVMFYFSWQLTLVALAIALLLAGLTAAVAPLVRERLNEQFAQGARIQAFVTEYVAGIETVKSLQFEAQLYRRYAEQTEGYLRTGYATNQLANGYRTAAGALEQALSLSVLVIGAWLAMQGPDFTVGMLVAFQMFTGRLTQPLMRITGLWQEFQQAAIAVRRLGDVMNAPSEPYGIVARRTRAGQGAIEFRALGFRHGEDRPWLYRNFNLAIEPGKTVVLMGPSGSGKSTLAKLLQGFYPVQEGQILIDGRDIRHLSANELRSVFGVVPQETVLFSGSLYQNLLMANPAADFEQIVGACRMAGIHEVIEALPEGYQSAVGERGSGLSGGQRQRIAVARALLKTPRVLIFDEAASGLDAATAERFAQTINRLHGKITVLFITHQIPKGLKADQVLMIGAQPQGGGAAGRPTSPGPGPRRPMAPIPPGPHAPAATDAHATAASAVRYGGAPLRPPAPTRPTAQTGAAR